MTPPPESLILSSAFLAVFPEMGFSGNGRAVFPQIPAEVRRNVDTCNLVCV
jgi:hypothetical protein